MASQNEEFRETAGWGWIIINLVAMAWITMPASIMVSRIQF